MPEQMKLEEWLVEKIVTVLADRPKDGWTKRWLQVDKAADISTAHPGFDLLQSAPHESRCLPGGLGVL